MRVYGGGAVCVSAFGVASPVFRHATFVNNSSDDRGGAVYVCASAVVRISNSIRWGNTAPNSPDICVEDLLGNTSLYRSIVPTGCPANLIGGDPQMGLLQDNGGFPPTLMPGACGAAMDAAGLAYCTPTDQRGVPRPHGAGCELGAVEITEPVFRNGFDS